MSEANGRVPENNLAPMQSEIYVLTDEQHLRALLSGAVQLGLIPAESTVGVRRARFEQAANGCTLQLWYQPAAPPAPPPPSPEAVHRALIVVMGKSAPSVRAVETWTREQLEEAVRWALAKELAKTEPETPIPPRPAHLGPEKKTGRRKPRATTEPADLEQADSEAAPPDQVKH